MVDEETKVCESCGRKLPLENFIKICGKCYSNTCKKCSSKKRNDTKYINKLKSGEITENDFVLIEQKYKKIQSYRVLKKSESGIDHIARDEKFVKLFDYKDIWASNYGRLIFKNDKGEYELLKGSRNRATGELKYTLQKNVYFKTKKDWGYKKETVLARDLVIQTFIVNYDIKNNTHCWHQDNLQKNVYFKTKKDWGYKKETVLARDLVIQTFIVNYDIKNNTHCWHQDNNVKDNYYKNLYPVTELQYQAIKERWEKNGSVSEDEIMEIVNQKEYKQQGWKQSQYCRTYNGRGYIGTDDVDYLSNAWSRWANMMQRCYSRTVHKQKPYYRKCNVCEEWLNFSNFKIWYDTHYIDETKVDLDKDLVGQKTNIYRPYYRKCNVCEEWLNFSNFKIWYDTHYIDETKVDLDKDLVGQKTNIYSPETCSFVPHYINTLFEDRGCKMLIVKTNQDTFKASISILNKKEDIGEFATEEQAKHAFSEYKQDYIMDIAEKNKGKIPDYVYDAMMKWKVAI